MPLRDYFFALYRAWGPQHWWPAATPFEIVVGAYLTQNTAWTNVELALKNLREADVLSIDGIRQTSIEDLEKLVRPAGFFRQKAARLKGFIAHLDANYGGDLSLMFTRPTADLRAELLALNGVGPETADSILLYAAQHEVFVVDAYTRRIFERHGLSTVETPYDSIRETVESSLRTEKITAEPTLSTGAPMFSIGAPTISTVQPSANGASITEPGPGPAPELPARSIPAVHEPSPMSEFPRSPLAQVFNEFHGLIVQTGKHHCLKKAPVCEGCPLAPLLPRDGPRGTSPFKPKGAA